MRPLAAATTVTGGMIAGGLALCGCGLDVVESHADTLAEYDDHGWLPASLLPPSTRDIDTRNNLDLNYSTGSFRFDAAVAARFTAGVREGAQPRSRFRDWNETIADARKDGQSVWQYAEDQTEWTFFCELAVARCEYMMWWVRP